MRHRYRIIIDSELSHLPSICEASQYLAELPTLHHSPCEEACLCRLGSILHLGPGIDILCLYCFTHTHTPNKHTKNMKKNKRRSIPVLPHKAVAEVSKIRRYRRGELLWRTDGRVNPLMDRKVVGIVFFGVVAMVSMVTSPTTAGCSVV